MEEINFFEEGGGVTFQVLVWYKKLSYFFADYPRLEAPLLPLMIKWKQTVTAKGALQLIVHFFIDL